MAEIIIRETDTNVTVVGRGELDLLIDPGFNKALTKALNTEKPIIVDFRDSGYIDSAILASLVKTGRKLHDRGERLTVLIKQGSHPAYVLKTVGFDRLMDMVES